jgi:hypothetical protein
MKTKPDDSTRSAKSAFSERKAVAGVNGLRVRDLGRRDDCRHVEVALRRRRRTDADRFIGQPDVLGFAVCFRMDDHGLDAEFAAGTLDAQRDFSAIGDEDFPEHGDSSSPSR